MDAAGTEWSWPWWAVIVGFNVISLVVCGIFFARSRRADLHDGDPYLRRMRIMGLVFALVAAYRSVFVSRYLTQMAWFDSIFNSSLLIRLFAWAAELSFAGLIALALLRFSRTVPGIGEGRGRVSRVVVGASPYVLLVCILLAQFFATYGVIAKSRVSFAIEETLWSIGFLSVLPLALMQLKRAFGAGTPVGRLFRQSSVIIALWCVLYCAYGVFYHLPLESWAGAVSQIRTGLPEVKRGWQAVTEAFSIVNESKAYADWGFGFLFWHSIYFTVCVWIALLLMRGPRLGAEKAG